VAVPRPPPPPLHEACVCGVLRPSRRCVIVTSASSYSLFLFVCLSVLFIPRPPSSLLSLSIAARARARMMPFFALLPCSLPRGLRHLCFSLLAQTSPLPLVPTPAHGTVDARPSKGSSQGRLEQAGWGGRTGRAGHGGFEACREGREGEAWSKEEAWGKKKKRGARKKCEGW
jgi:hypothetical protein